MPRKNKKRSVTIIAGWIMGGAAIIAAIISIMPNIMRPDKGNSNTSAPTPTDVPITTPFPLVFNTYNDPWGIFNIEIPQDFFVESRIPDALGLIVEFVSMDSPDVSMSVFFNFLFLEAEATIEPFDLVNTRVPSNFVISNNKTQRGYLTHYLTYDKVSHYYELIESESEITVYLRINVNVSDLDEFTPQEIEHVISSFEWFPAIAAER